MTSIPSLKWMVYLPLMPSSSSTGVIGQIKVSCFRTNGFNNPGAGDGAVFLIENTTGSVITEGVFTLGDDSFEIGTIAAFGSVMIVPKVGIAANAPMQFAGWIGGLAVDSGQNRPRRALTNLRRGLPIDFSQRRADTLTPGFRAGLLT